MLDAVKESRAIFAALGIVPTYTQELYLAARLQQCQAEARCELLNRLPKWLQSEVTNAPTT